MIGCYSERRDVPKIDKGDLNPHWVHKDQIAINFHLWTFVSKMTVFSALKASNLIQSLETMGPAVTLEKSLSTVLIPFEISQPCHLATFIGTAAYHGVHSVIALRVGHECFA